MPVKENENPKRDEQAITQPSQEQAKSNQPEQPLKNDTPKTSENAQPQKPDTAQENKQPQDFGKLLPFLTVKAEFHKNRLQDFENRIANVNERMERAEGKIQALTDRVTALRKENQLLEKQQDMPFVKGMMERNNRRIEQIEQDKIPNQQDKIADLQDRAFNLKGKVNRTQHKLDRLAALSDVVKAFVFRSVGKRRERFADALDRLNTASLMCLQDKKINFTDKRDVLASKHEWSTSSIEKLQLQEQIDKLNQKINAVDERIAKIDVKENHFEKIKDEPVMDDVIQATGEKLNEFIYGEDLSMPIVGESVVETAIFASAPEAEIRKEMAMKKLGTAIAKEEQGIEIATELAEHAPDAGFREYAMNDVAQRMVKLQELQAELVEVVRTPAEELKQKREELESEQDTERDVEEYMQEMVADGKADVDRSGAVKINPEYYKSLPRNDRHIEVMPENQAQAVMRNLKANGIEFSAVKRENGKVAITVSNKDILPLQAAKEQPVQQANVQIKRNPQRTQAKTINPDYYKALPKEERAIFTESKGVAQDILKRLQDHEIQFSAVERKDAVGITVSTQNQQAYENISKFVKNNRAAEYVNPEFFRSLKPQERRTVPMSEEQARATVQKLQAKGIAHSAIFNGGKSAVTTKRATFSRAKLKNEAQRVSKQQAQKPKEQTKKKAQGIE